MTPKEIIAQYGITGTVNGMRIENRRVEIAGLEEMLSGAMADAYLRGQRAAIEASARIVDGWHISKGGYGNLAETVRMQPILPLKEGE